MKGRLIRGKMNALRSRRRELKGAIKTRSKRIAELDAELVRVRRVLTLIFGVSREEETL